MNTKLIKVGNEDIYIHYITVKTIKELKRHHITSHRYCNSMIKNILTLDECKRFMISNVSYIGITANPMNYAIQYCKTKKLRHFYLLCKRLKKGKALRLKSKLMKDFMDDKRIKPLNRRATGGKIKEEKNYILLMC
jgi:hypothetical protein